MEMHPRKTDAREVELGTVVGSGRPEPSSLRSVWQKCETPSRGSKKEKGRAEWRGGLS